MGACIDHQPLPGILPTLLEHQNSLIHDLLTQQDLITGIVPDCSHQIIKVFALCFY